MPTAEEQRRALAQQALAAWGGSPMVPLAGGADPLDPVAQQDAMLAAQAQQDAQMAVAGPPAPAPVAAPTFVDPESVMSTPAEMSPPPAPLSAQQQLAAAAYRSWSPQASPQGLAAWEPTPEAAGPPTPAQPGPKVIAVPEQDITAKPAPAPAPGGGSGGGGARSPSLLTEQTAMANASRDAANQARTDADISTDIQAELTTMGGEQQAEMYRKAGELAANQQTALEEAGRVAGEQRRIKEAVATDLQAQHKKLNDEAAAIQISDKRSTGQRVMGALAIALGGLSDQGNLAAGLNIGQNVQTHNADRAISMVNDSIERDLAIQRANLENKRASAAAKYSELGIARDAIKDVNAQESLAKAALMDKYALSLDAIKQQGMGEQATTTAALAAEQLRGNAAQLRAQTFEQQAAKDEDRLWALQVQREQEKKAAAAARANANRPMSPKELADLEGKLLENEGKRRELEGGGNVYGLRPISGKPSDSATTEAQKIVAGTEGVRATLGQLKQMAAAGMTLSPTERAIARRRLASLKSQFNGTFGDGTAPNEAQLQELDTLFVNPTEANLADAERVFDVFDQDAQEMARAKVRGYGFAYETPDVRPE